MIQLIRPSWGLFDRLVAQAKTDLVLCTPWISTAGLQRLQRLLLDARAGAPARVQLWGRIADLKTDSPGILELVRRLEAAGISTVVRDSPRMHAKVCLADRTLALVSSANLSEGGFPDNIEAAVIISEPEGVKQVAQLLAGIEAETVLVSAPDLEHFVTKQRCLLAAQTPPGPAPAIVPVWRRPKPAAKQPGQS